MIVLGSPNNKRDKVPTSQFKHCYLFRIFCCITPHIIKPCPTSLLLLNEEELMSLSCLSWLPYSQDGGEDNKNSDLFILCPALV